VKEEAIRVCWFEKNSRERKRPMKDGERG